MESPFRTTRDPDFRLIETFGFHPGEGFRRLDRHLARMARSAAALGLSFDHDRAIACLEGIEHNSALRCRLTLDCDGAFAVTTGALGAISAPWNLAISETRLDPEDPWLQHKTTRRRLYDETRANLPKGVDEMLFLNTQGEVCEGTITTVFVELATGQLATPPLSSGLLPGVLREQLVESGDVVEAVVTDGDLRAAKAIWVGNSLRGKIAAQLVAVRKS